MYLSHFGLNEPPFRITPDTGFFFAGANRGATLEALQYAILHEEGIVKVCGEVGSGKTMLCRVLIERLPKSVEIIYLANPSLSREEILLALADELGMNPETVREPGTRLLKSLTEKLISLYSQGRRVVVLVDEAHAMPKETLEEIRLLSNLESRHDKLLHLVLFGQPELDAHLDSPDMRPLRERITHSFRLEPLVRTDIEGYIEFRLRTAGYRGPNPFAPGAVRLISDASLGLTRRINILCDKSLLAAFAASSHAVTEREARRAIADAAFAKFPGRLRLNGSRLALAGALAGLAAGLVIAWIWLREPAPRPDRAASPAAALTAHPAAHPGAKSAPADGEPAAGSTQADPSSPLGDGGVGAGAALPAPAPDPVAPAVQTVRMEMALRAPPKSDQTNESEPGEPRKDPATGAVTNTLRSGAPAGAAGDAPSAPRPEAADRVATGSIESPQAGSPEPPPKGKIVQQRFLATQEWLKRAPPDNYSIQLMVANSSELVLLEDFLRKTSDLLGENELYVYSVRINGVQHFRASYGNYLNLADLREAMKSLPPLLLAQQPFPRTFDRMRRHNSQ